MHLKHDKKILAGFLGCILILLIIGTLSFKNSHDYNITGKWVNHTHEVLYDLEQILLTAVDAETGERGYIITGDDVYLEPFRRSQAAVDSLMTTIKKETTDNAVQQRMVRQLDTALTNLFKRLNLCIEARRDMGFEAAGALVKTGEGKRMLDHIRGQIQASKMLELSLLNKRIQESNDTMRSFNIVVGFLILSCVVFLTLFYFLVTGYLTELKKAEQQTSEKNEALLKNMILLETSGAELKEYQKNLQVSNNMLARTNQELGSFAYAASHDLQEPLRKIITFANILHENDNKSLTEVERGYLDKIQIAAKSMRKLIEDLLSFARLDNVDTMYEKADINQLLEEVKLSLQEAHTVKNFEIRSSQLPVLRVVPHQIRQLFTNLLSNSLKFGKKDVPEVITIESEILSGSEHPQLRPHQTYVHIRISDNGIGFDPSYAEHIFEVFKRLHTKQEYSGTGIGLAICKKIVQNHHGLITATGRPGEGATFDIYLPY